MKIVRAVLALAGLLGSFGAWGGSVSVQGMRLWAAPDNTRVVFDISAPVDYSLQTLAHPDRIVVDFNHAQLQTALPAFNDRRGVIKAVRAVPREAGTLRLVLELNTPVQPRSFTLKPNDQYGHRLVLDLYPQATAAAAMASNPATSPSHSAPKKTLPDSSRDLVIAIDAGHGGDDPGARGSAGTFEKNVVLAIARRLQNLVENERGMHPVMIRDGDYYVGLRQRIQKARAHKADLFVSIHADAFTDRRARGSSVFTLSQRGASSEAARWLAESENASDLIGGVSLDDKDDVLASVLLDLSQSATSEASLDVGDKVLGNLSHIGSVHKARVQQAGFVVLKSPDIPSILVETAFISNPEEERKLRDSRHQQVLAQAIMNGIRSYFAHRAPPGTVVAQNTPGVREHVIGPGDTLSGIAQQYNVSLRSLRAANGLRDANDIRIGKVLRIPTDSDS